MRRLSEGCHACSAGVNDGSACRPYNLKKNNINSKESGRNGRLFPDFLCHSSQNRAEYPRNLVLSATIYNFAASNDKIK